DISLMASGMGGELIKRGRVDAFSADEIAVGEAIHQGYRDLVDTAEFKFPMPGSGVNALKDWLPKNREAAARFVKSTVDALALIKTDKQAAFAAMAKWYGITDPRTQCCSADPGPSHTRRSERSRALPHVRLGQYTLRHW